MCTSFAVRNNMAGTLGESGCMRHFFSHEIVSFWKLREQRSVSRISFPVHRDASVILALPYLSILTRSSHSRALKSTKRLPLLSGDKNLLRLLPTTTAASSVATRHPPLRQSQLELTQRMHTCASNRYFYNFRVKRNLGKPRSGGPALRAAAFFSSSLP